MANEEVSPALSISELETILSFSAEVGAKVTADMLMGSYWVRESANRPIEESEDVTYRLSLYDADWKRLDEAGVSRPEENDPRVLLPDSTQLPAFTNIVNARLFQPRDEAKARWVELAQNELNKLRDRTRQEVVRAIGAVGLTRVNELLQLLGVGVDEQGEPTYEEVESSQLESVRHVARLMSPAHRNMVRMNALIADPKDVEALIGTDIEDPELREKYNALLRGLGDPRVTDEEM